MRLDWHDLASGQAVTLGCAHPADRLVAEAGSGRPSSPGRRAALLPRMPRRNRRPASGGDRNDTASVRGRDAGRHAASRRRTVAAAALAPGGRLRPPPAACRGPAALPRGRGARDRPARPARRVGHGGSALPRRQAALRPHRRPVHPGGRTDAGGRARRHLPRHRVRRADAPRDGRPHPPLPRPGARRAVHVCPARLRPPAQTGAGAVAHRHRRRRRAAHRACGPSRRGGVGRGCRLPRGQSRPRRRGLRRHGSSATCN